MRKFSSYGAIDIDLHFYEPRTELIDYACTQLIGENSSKGGHYITVWAPRQTGKTWLMQQVVARLQEMNEFEVGIITMQSAKEDTNDESVLELFVSRVGRWFKRDLPNITDWKQLTTLFTADHFSKPVILIIDEFDAIENAFINRFANEFRDMYTQRTNDRNTPSSEKDNLLHGLALIGVRSVLGIENVTGSPFNVQRSVHIPNLTENEVQGIYHWYERESGQRILPAVIDRVYYEMKGQPGLTCWMGELLTEVHNRHDGEITMDDFEYAYSDAVDVQPNNNILNIISKAKKEEYKPLVLEMFQAGAKLPFRYDDPVTNFLYMNGVVSREVTQDETGRYQHSLKFPSPFVQKRLFNYFAHQLFQGLKRLYDPFIDLSNIMTDTHLNIQNILRLYEAYMQKNRHWLFRDAPRRMTDDHIYEAVYHFNLYMYLKRFLELNGAVIPEFPTGNGKIDLIVYYSDKTYPLEVKSFVSQKQHKEDLKQAAKYAKTLGVEDAWLIVFVEVITDEQRAKFEVTHHDGASGVDVHPVFVTMVDPRLES